MAEEFPGRWAPVTDELKNRLPDAFLTHCDVAFSNGRTASDVELRHDELGWFGASDEGIWVGGYSDRWVATHYRAHLPPQHPGELSEQLAAHRQVPEGECPINVRCQKHDFFHGAEATELRERLEKLVADHGSDDIAPHEIQRILDEVDARDSLAQLQAVDGKGE